MTVLKSSFVCLTTSGILSLFTEWNFVIFYLFLLWTYHYVHYVTCSNKNSIQYILFDTTFVWFRSFTHKMSNGKKIWKLSGAKGKTCFTLFNIDCVSFLINTLIDWRRIWLHEIFSWIIVKHEQVKKKSIRKGESFNEAFGFGWLSVKIICY